MTNEELKAAFAKALIDAGLILRRDTDYTGGSTESDEIPFDVFSVTTADGSTEISLAKLFGRYDDEWPKASPAQGSFSPEDVGKLIDIGGVKYQIGSCEG